MSDYVPITQGIRDICNGNTTIPTYLLYDECDNIDAMYKSMEGRYADLRGFADRVREVAENHEDMTVFGVDYMALPLDADGVPIHVGDVMKGEKVGGGFGEPFEVVGYIMSNGELEPMDEDRCPRTRKYLHHHHEPTVADILRQFADEIITFCTSVEDHECVDAIEEFSKRLRLAEEE